MSTRRSFLGLIGISAAAGPLAAKAALDEGIAKQAGISLFGGGAGIPAGAPSSTGQAGIGSYIPWEDRIAKSSTYIKMFGLPEFADRELRQRSQWIGSFDPDIAVKRSWSMAVKIQEQRQRNYERGFAAIHDTPLNVKAKGALQKVLGFEWPW